MLVLMGQSSPYINGSMQLTLIYTVYSSNFGVSSSFQETVFVCVRLNKDVLWYRSLEIEGCLDSSRSLQMPKTLATKLSELIIFLDLDN
jgi:hypothetical protein